MQDIVCQTEQALDDFYNRSYQKITPLSKIFQMQHRKQTKGRHDGVILQQKATKRRHHSHTIMKSQQRKGTKESYYNKVAIK